jgi:hypothetical protein
MRRFGARSSKRRALWSSRTLRALVVQQAIYSVSAITNVLCKSAAAKAVDDATARWIAVHGECSVQQFAALDEFVDLSKPSQLCLPEE